MHQGLQVVVFAALAALVLVLGAGLWNMLRGGSANLSQKLMRARIILQFAAIIVLMSALFWLSPK